MPLSLTKIPIYNTFNLKLSEFKSQIDSYYFDYNSFHLGKYSSLVYVYTTYSLTNIYHF